MDPYKILGVNKNATQEEIKNAYRALAKKHHPDRNPGNKESEAKFKTISAAYEKIGNPEDRGKFDRGETQEQMEENFWRQERGGAQFAGSFDGDFFENLFRSANRGGSRRVDFPGEDQLFQMEVDFRDAARGAQREITLPQGKKLQVKIPAGIESGARLRFRGQGEPGIGNGPSGDLYIEIHVRPLAGFERKGTDIESELPVSFVEAILGAEVPVQTLDGTVSLKVPPGVSTGSKLRIKGKGVLAKNSVGDQIVRVKIVMPKKIDPALQAALRSWEGKFSYNPRSS